MKGLGLVQFVHDIISTLDGAMNQGTSRHIWSSGISQRPSIRSNTGGYYINSITMRYEGPPINGSAHGSLVDLDGQASDPVPVLSSVPVGSVLGPILFSNFHIPDNIKSSVRLFANECVLYIGTFIQCKKILTVLGSWRPIGKWSSMLPNVTLWEWLGIAHTN